MELLLTLAGWTCVSIAGFACIAAGLACLCTVLTAPSERERILKGDDE